jgi:hypothetical protein
VQLLSTANSASDSQEYFKTAKLLLEATFTPMCPKEHMRFGGEKGLNFGSEKKLIAVLSRTQVLGSLADSQHLFSGVVKSSYADLQLRPPANFSAFLIRPYHSQLGHSIFSVLPLSQVPQHSSPLAWNIYKKIGRQRR